MLMKSPKRAGQGENPAAVEAAHVPRLTTLCSHEPSTHGSPCQEWSTAQKAIWFLYVAKPGKPLSGYSIAKAFNKQFKSSGAIIGGNVNKYLEKEKLKGTSSTVGADMSDGTARYYLTDAGKTTGAQLAKGIAA